MPLPIVAILTGIQMAAPMLMKLFNWMVEGEQLFTKPGQGKKKKKFVMDKVTDLLVSTGAPAADTKKSMKEISKTVDNIVKLTKKVNPPTQ
jgi:hypothetical protein